MFCRTILLLAVGLGGVLPGHAQPSTVSDCKELPPATNCKMLSDFEGEEPLRDWRGTKNRELIRLSDPKAMTPNQNVRVYEEGGNHFARVYTKDQAFRVVFSKKHALDWSLEERPYLRWTWRARTLPKGANEKRNDTNDTGGALYVTVEKNWLGMPKSIKYTYSSTLPVGTTVDYGVLKVLVVASKAEQGTGKWITHERNVLEDYKRLFGDQPDGSPLAIMMWADSDTVHDEGVTDFDNIMLLSRPSDSQSMDGSP